MGKYAPLGEFLRKQKATLVPMTFGEIERVVGTQLPNSQRYPAWWSNNPWNNVMTKIWLDAGFETEQVDVERRKLVFRRVGPVTSAAVDSSDANRAQDNQGGSSRHPMIGWMKGTFTIAPGVDLTEPAMPEWGEVVYGDKTWDDFK
jgi:hypothetical protein